MKKIPQTAIVHVVIKQKVAIRGQRVALETDQIPVLNAANSLEFSFKFFNALGKVRIDSLDSHWLAILENTFINCT